jgi:hypothetical protein
VRAARVDEDNHAGYWEHPSLIFFVEKNRGAKTELLEGLYNNGVDWSGGLGRPWRRWSSAPFLCGKLADKNEQKTGRRGVAALKREHGNYAPRVAGEGF